MRRIRTCSITLALLLSVVPATPQARAPSRPDRAIARGVASSSTTIDAARLRQLRERMQSSVRKGTVAGMTTLIAHRGRVVSLIAFGEQDIERHIPMQTDTIFQVRSMTKSFTAVAVMTLVDAGKLNLRDPVAKYIPEFAAIQLAEMSDSGPKLRAPLRPPTIYDLLTHTSGLPNEPPRELAPPLFASKTLTEAAARVAPVSLKDDPGAAFSYSDLGYIVLGGVIEAASGTGFEQYLKQTILGPLGMKDSFLVFREDKVSRIASTYRLVDGKLQKSEYYDISRLTKLALARPSSSLFSTAADLLAFYQMMLNGGTYGGVRILSPAAVRLMTAAHVAVGEMPTVYAGADYGLGWVVKTHPKSRHMYEAPGSYGHGGLLGTAAWVDPERQLIRIFLVSRAPNSPADTVFDERQAFMTMAAAAVLE